MPQRSALDKLHSAKRELDEVLAALNEAQRQCVGIAPDAIMFLHEAKQATKQARNRMTIEQSKLKAALAHDGSGEPCWCGKSH